MQLKIKKVEIRTRLRNTKVQYYLYWLFENRIELEKILEDFERWLVKTPEYRKRNFLGTGF
jgi:hypothetical protein|tara:strand:+ start:2523 stop:2705 length:183 start_codon:yes stop_codon:yes gene_type:complete